MYQPPDIGRWAFKNHPKSIGKIPIPNSPYTVWNIIADICSAYSTVVIEKIIDDTDIKLLAISISELCDILRGILSPEQYFTLWQFLDDAISELKIIAMTEECYEGLANLKKLEYFL